MGNIDLHTHTTKSDGTLTPVELIELASELGLSAVAITDHDTVAGVVEAVDASDKYNVEVIPGIEMSTGWNHTEIHMLGYCFNPNADSIVKAREWCINDRNNRNNTVAELMRADGFDVDVEVLKKRYPESTLGRPHFAVRLMELGAADSVKDAFDRFLAPGKKYYVKRNYLSIEQVINTIHEAGGKAVIAHPFQYKFEDNVLREFIEYCKTFGLDGMECRYSLYDSNQTEYLESLAREYNLLITGGSDFHGDHKPHISLGTGTGSLCVPYECLEKLKNR